VVAVGGVLVAIGGVCQVSIFRDNGSVFGHNKKCQKTRKEQ
jgi:hypothetical protein